MELKKIELEEAPITQSSTIVGEPKKSKKRFWKKKWFLGLIGALLVIILAIGIPGFFVFGQAKNVYAETLKLKEAAKTKDLKLIKERIASTRGALSGLDKSLIPLSWLRIVPVLGGYQQDAVHLVAAGEAGLDTADIVITSLTPYADIIGLSGGQAVGGGEKTAEDRITFLVATLDKIGPDLDKINAKLKIVKSEVEKINPGRYPENFRGRQIRGPLTEMIGLVDEFASLTSDAKPILEVSPWLLGNDSPRNYLVLFQNDGELRPTGGFITAYAILKVDKGKVTPVLSEDIYALDDNYKSTLKAPDSLVKYVPLPYQKDPTWRLRDMNISPDFSVSMQTFSPEFQKASKYKYDGIIAIDTEFLTRLLKVLGPIGVPEWGNFSAEPDKRCDGCAQVVYQLENMITRPLNKIVKARKAVLGPLMHSILSNAFGSPKEKLPGLFEAAFSSVQDKHAMFYFPDQKIQSAMEAFNIAGRIKDYNGDYFALYDTNFAGSKANIFIHESVDQKVEIGRDGKVTRTVIVTYKNPSPPSDCNLERGGLCLNAPYRDWVRLYVPKGSKLIESSGFDTDLKTYDDLGKTVFEGFYGDKYPLRPQGQAKVTFKYELPFQVKNGDYNFLIQKQPGTKDSEYTVEINKQKQDFQLKGDKELKFKI